MTLSIIVSNLVANWHVSVNKYMGFHWYNFVFGMGRKKIILWKIISYNTDLTLTFIPLSLITENEWCYMYL